MVWLQVPGVVVSRADWPLIHGAAPGPDTCNTHKMGALAWNMKEELRPPENTLLGVCPGQGCLPRGGGVS